MNQLTNFSIDITLVGNLFYKQSRLSAVKYIGQCNKRTYVRSSCYISYQLYTFTSYFRPHIHTDKNKSLIDINALSYWMLAVCFHFFSKISNERLVAYLRVILNKSKSYCDFSNLTLCSFRPLKVPVFETSMYHFLILY